MNLQAKVICFGSAVVPGNASAEFSQFLHTGIISSPPTPGVRSRSGRLVVNHSVSRSGCV